MQLSNNLCTSVVFYQNFISDINRNFSFTYVHVPTMNWTFKLRGRQPSSFLNFRFLNKLSLIKSSIWLFSSKKKKLSYNNYHLYCFHFLINRKILIYNVWYYPTCCKKTENILYLVLFQKCFFPLQIIASLRFNNLLNDKQTCI